jgi:hypothetical protein
MACEALIAHEKSRKATARTIARMTKIARPTNHIGRIDGRPFPLPSPVG